MEKYYKTLNLEITATLEEVKEKYNQLVEEFNPEKQEDDLKDFFTEEQNKIKEAYRNILENIINSNEEDKKDNGLQDENEGEFHDLGEYQVSEETKFSDNEPLDGAIKVVSFCFPIVGGILYFVHMNKSPQKAKDACHMALWGMGISLLLNILAAMGG